MARKKKPEEHVNHERWLVSYADFITLLFAFFVVMFAASNADKQKAGQVARSVEAAFSELALFKPSGKVFPLYDEGGLPSAGVNIIGKIHSGFAEGQLVSADGDGKYDIKAVQERLESMLGEELAKGRVRMNIDERGLTISLAEAGFFDPGSAVIQRAALPVVDGIAEKLRDLPWDVRIEGHTDNMPITTAQFPSNWELSTSRATYVLKHLISINQISPNRLSAVGYSEYRPVASNSTREGRGLNRRVDIVILSTTAQAFEPKAMPETGEASDVEQSASSGEAEPVAQTSSLPEDD